MFHYDIKILKQVQSIKELSLDTESKRKQEYIFRPKDGKFSEIYKINMGKINTF